MVICLRMEKTYTEKTPPGDFKVTIPENSLLSKQAVISKEILVPYTNLQLNPYPNTQLDLFCSDNLSFQCMAPNMWLTNCADRNTQLNHQLEKEIGCKVLLFITRWRSRSCSVTKPYNVQNTTASWREWRTRQTRFLITLFFTLVQLCSCATVRNLLWPLK